MKNSAAKQADFVDEPLPLHTGRANLGPSNASQSGRTGRVIPLAGHGGAENMAIDQAMLESVDAGGPPTLRLYLWNEPTLSLGYFQNYDERKQHVESRGVACVRRSSGGGAILHDQELTYSIAWPTTGLQTGANRPLYRNSHDALVAAISDFGVSASPFSATVLNKVSACDNSSYPAATSRSDPFLCFQRRTDDDLIVSGYKILGSAQRKGKRAVLQHGSLLIRASRFAPQLPGIWDLGATAASAEGLAEALVEHLANQLEIDWTDGQWTTAERDRAAEISENRFATESWLHRR
ncbi:lipoate--protein ligase family protein [Rubripirellula reticaptiva]|uniref:Octanoyltransferase LipM n=1 Tax=Rubripirellula reticaptiva TaxID=2528013 RepID=A0A5C6F9C9_9BACT|nr:lipoate--protein ligase family protein [Rubripirellula reticaptiva]TWU57482.1 Octanoyltransferase LipM [Rubripirellula reticaptiva]